MAVAAATESGWRSSRGKPLRRVQRLRSEGVITGIRAAVDPDQLGLHLQAFVLVELSEHTLESDHRFANALAQMPQVLRADTIAGHEDILMHVVARDAPDLQRVLRALPQAGARRITTLLRLDTVKPPSPIPAQPNR